MSYLDENASGSKWMTAMKPVTQNFVKLVHPFITLREAKPLGILSGQGTKLQTSASNNLALCPQFFGMSHSPVSIPSLY